MGQTCARRAMRRFIFAMIALAFVPSLSLAHVLCGVNVTLDTQPRAVADGATVTWVLRYCDAMGIDGSEIEFITLPVDVLKVLPGSARWTSCPTGGCSIDSDGTLRLPRVVLKANECISYEFTFTLQPGQRGGQICEQGALRAIAAGTSLPCDRPTDDPLVIGSAPTCITVNDAAPGCTVAPAVTPAVHQGCAGVAMTLDASSSSAAGCPGTQLAYQWTRDGVAIPGATAATWTLTASEPPGTATYRCLVGCAGLPACRNLSTSVSVTLLGPGEIVAESPVCLGRTVLVSVPGGSTCLIDCGDGSPPVPACLVNCNYPATGRYIASADATDSLGCSANFTRTIDVIATPVACLATPTELCELVPGGPTWLRLTNCSDPGLRPRWSSTAGVIDNPDAFEPLIELPDVSVPTAIDLTLEVSTPACPGTDRSTRTVTLMPAPNALFSHLPAVDPCPGETITFTPGAASSAGPFAYAWDFGDSATSTAAQPTHAYAGSGTWRVTLTRTDLSTGCASLWSTDIVVPDPCCSPSLAPVTSVLVQKTAAAADVIVGWDAHAGASEGYNTWLVGRREDLPDAHEPGGPGIIRLCGAGGPEWCYHSGGRLTSAGTMLYYQVRALCRTFEGQ